jgi:hypothetical protein
VVETTLIGFALGADADNDFSVSGWIDSAKKFTAEIASEGEFERAFQRVISKGLIRW